MVVCKNCGAENGDRLFYSPIYVPVSCTPDIPDYGVRASIKVVWPCRICERLHDRNNELYIPDKE